MRSREVDVRAVAGCGLLLLMLLPLSGTAAARPVPGPPSASDLRAAAGQVSRDKGALGSASRRLSAANARLAALNTQAEALTERYDQTVVDEQRAQAAYQVTQARWVRARRAALASQREVGQMAASEYETGGGYGSPAAVVGDPSGPEAYLRAIGVSQVLAQNAADLLASNQANNLVARLFRAQARDLLRAKEADLRAEQALKQAIDAALARERDLVAADKAAASSAAARLADAQARQAALQAARQAALAAAAQASAAAAARRAASDGGPSATVQAPSWAYGSGASASQGDVAADWALSQIGKPYVWGAAGPDAYDCSGLTMEAWSHAGVSLLHYTGYQWVEGPHVPLDQLQRGDLVFYATNTSDPSTIHHVGMYIGNGMMVDAPYTGATVRIDPIADPGLIGAVRPAS